MEEGIRAAGLGPALQAEQRGDDASGGDLVRRGAATVGERLRHQRIGQRRHGAGDETLAEVAVVAHRVGRAADDARIVDVDRIGDDGGGGVGPRCARRQHRHRVGDAEREAAPAPARGGDAAHRRRGADREAAVVLVDDRPGHQHMVVVLAPSRSTVAARQGHRDLAPLRRSGAAATAAAQAVEPQALVRPAPRSQVRAATCSRERTVRGRDVGALREHRMVLEQRSDPLRRS